MTASIAEPRLHSPSPADPPCPATRPVLCRLAEILPPPVSTAPEPSPPAPVVADPAASAHVDRVLRAVVEILGGRRPARQLSTVLRPDLLAYLVGLQAVAGVLRPQVRRVFARSQGIGVLEAVVLVSLSTGVRALAARFEEEPDGGTGRWRCTALQLRLTSGDLATHRHRR